MDFFELVKLSTIGPLHLRLNQDVLELIKEKMHASKDLLKCDVCQCTVLKDVNGTISMQIQYFTNTTTDTHTCFNCSRWGGSVECT